MKNNFHPLNISADLQATLNGLQVRIKTGEDKSKINIILRSWKDAISIAWMIRRNSVIGKKLKQLHHFGRITKLRFQFCVNDHEVSSLGHSAKPGLLNLLV